MNTHSNPETNSRALVDNTLILGGAIAIVALVLIVIVAALGATLLGMEFAEWIAGALVIGAGIFEAFLILRTWENVRWILVEPIAALVARQDAETNAIQGQTNAVFQTVNAEAGAKVKASITAPRVSVMGKSVSWNQLNQLNQTAPEPKRLEFPREDVLWMLEQFIAVKHSKRPFVGQELPYSRLPAYPELYNEVVRILVDGQAIQGRGPRDAGTLTLKEIGALAKMIDAEHPRGVVIDVQAMPPTLLNSGK